MTNEEFAVYIEKRREEAIAFFLKCAYEIDDYEQLQRLFTAVQSGLGKGYRIAKPSTLPKGLKENL